MLWDHYLLTGDDEALRRYYPLFKGAARFFLDTLVEDPGTAAWSPIPPFRPRCRTTVS